MPETRFQSLGQEELPGEEMAAPSSLLVWKISWTEEPGGLQSMLLLLLSHFSHVLLGATP